MLAGQRIIVREVDGSCWAAITEAEKVALENHGADIMVLKTWKGTYIIPPVYMKALLDNDEPIIVEKPK